MQQLIQFDSNFQPQFAETLLRDQDCICTVPSGVSWFNLIDDKFFQSSQELTVILYPNQGLLKQHATYLDNFNQYDNRLAILTNDIPPNEERHIWKEVNNRRISCLLMTAKRFQSLSTLGHLIQHNTLKRIILTHGHLVIPHLWGPFFENPYLGLAELLRTQWINRPPLTITSQPLPPQYIELFNSMFEMKNPHNMEVCLPLNPQQVTVKRSISQYQKLRQLKKFIQADNRELQHKGVFIICQSLKDISFLEKRLSPIVVLPWHSRLKAEEKEACLLEAIHKQDWVILAESRVMTDFPIHMLPVRNLKIVHWQIPWSMEALTQQLILSVNKATENICSVVLYSKEDYFSNKKLITVRCSELSSSKPIYMDHLNRLRYFCAFSKDCYDFQIKNRIKSKQYNPVPCKNCDNCKNRDRSSLWRKILDPFIY